MPLLVFDFDGTVSLGDEPVIAYASRLGVETDVARYLATDGREPAELAGAIDGYAATVRAARARGVPGEDIRAAYLASRIDLAEGRVSTHAPDGLAEFLDALPSRAVPVLVTNAPEDGVTEQLEKLGLARFFARRVTSAGKPDRMRQVLEGLLAEHDAAPAELVSIGDIWRNDLEAAHAMGAETALVDRFLAPPEATPTVRAPSLEDLYPYLAAFAAR